MLGRVTGFAILMLIATLFLYVLPTKAYVVTDGLVAYWSLDSATNDGKNVKDLWGENDGVIAGKPKTVAGYIGEALEFNGTEDAIEIEGTETLDFSGKEEMTVAAWVNADSDAPVEGAVPGQCCGTIVAQRDALSWALRFDSRVGGAEYEFIVCPSWQGDGGFGVPTFNPGEWRYLTAVVNGDQMQFYLDGELAKEQPYAGPMVAATSETEIGHAGDGGFVGLIDEVLIYDRPLEAEEIKQNFEAKRFAAVDPTDKLATYWAQVKILP